MNTWIIAYLIGSASALLLLVVLMLKQQSIISSMKKCIDNESGNHCILVVILDTVRKIESAVNWFIERKGMKIERTQLPTSHEWTIVPVQKGHELEDLWRQIQMHREEIVYALYESTKNALEDHDKEKEKKKGKKK